jgi:hypothetical protein
MLDIWLEIVSRNGDVKTGLRREGFADENVVVAGWSFDDETLTRFKQLTCFVVSFGDQESSFRNSW